MGKWPTSPFQLFPNLDQVHQAMVGNDRDTFRSIPDGPEISTEISSDRIPPQGLETIEDRRKDLGLLRDNEAGLASSCGN